MIPNFEDCTLEQRQQYYYNAHYCMYCKSETEYVNSLAVYKEDYGMVHLCTNKSCGAYVGCIPGSDQSFGTVGNKKLRDLRQRFHEVYDPLWQKKVAMGGITRNAAQVAARKWMASFLGIEVVECHAGYFTESLCKLAIAECEKYYLTADQVEQKRLLLKYQIDLVHEYSKEFLFEVKQFEIMGMVQMELKHSDGKVLYLKPKSKEARWAHKKKPFKFEDIEQLIIEHFKP